MVIIHLFKIIPLYNVHVSAETRTWLDCNLVNTSVWPPQSPDINLIENLWRETKVKLRKNINDCPTPSDLYQLFQNIFFAIPEAAIQNLYYTIPRRLKAVIRNKGTLTKYRISIFLLFNSLI